MRGSAFIEASVVLIVLVPVMLVIFDLCTIVIALQANDSTCREAARVAASGSPLQAQIRAQAVIDKANNHLSAMISNFSLASFESTVSNGDVAALGTYGGSLTGTITVQTDVCVHPLVVQLVYSGKSPLHFRSLQSFPLTFVVPNTTTG